MDNKIGFWPVLAIVVGSQIGSGIYMLPATLAPYGIYSMYGWLIAGVGAVSLAIVFACLCAHFPKTGGPHVYVGKMFGTNMAFFTGWTYWVISWVSTTAVIITAIGALDPFLGSHSMLCDLSLEIGLLLLITMLNLWGVQAAGRAEFCFSILKFIPLILVPIMAVFYYDSSHIAINVISDDTSVSNVLGKVTLLTLWAFIGVESATTPAGSVHNPSKTIPMAIIIGTVLVLVVYLCNSIGIMGLVDSTVLENSKTPFADVTQAVFGGNWHLLISAIVSLTCIGTINAWVLTSGQIALGNAEDCLMPKFFSKTNKNNAPYNALIISAIGMIPFLILTKNDSFASQLTMIVDISVTAFLYVYLICCLAFIKLLITSDSQTIKLRKILLLVAVVATSFCCWIIYETPMETLLIAFAFVLTGVPVYLYMKFKN